MVTGEGTTRVKRIKTDPSNAQYEASSPSPPPISPPRDLPKEIGPPAPPPVVID